MSVTLLRAFRPLGQNKTVNIAVTTSPQTLNFGVVPFGTQAIRLVNNGTATIFIEFGDPTISPPTASAATSQPMLPGTVEVFTLDTTDTQISVIGSAAGSTLYVTLGEGL